MDQSANPYAPPKHDEPGSDARPTSEAGVHLEAIRREHINAEANVKGLGLLLYLGAGGLILPGLAALNINASASALSVVGGGVLGLSAYWLRRLDRRGRLVYSVITGFGVATMLLGSGSSSDLIAYQFGRVFWPLLFMAVIWSAKASTVMTPHYRDVVIPATPHVKRKTSPVLIVLLVLLVLTIGVVILAGA